MVRWYPVPLAALAFAACAPAPAAAPAGPTPAAPAAAPARVERPIPEAMAPTAGFRRAIARGTRTATGQPGPRYWQQWASYRIRVSLDAERRRLSGTERVVYHNRSPDTLSVVYMHLVMNHHAPGVVRNEEAEATGGVALGRVAAHGETLRETEGRGPGWATDATRLLVRPTRPLLPGDSIDLELEWSFPIPQAGAGGRMGWSKDNLFHLAYFYPQVAVYDDVVGWQVDPFLGGAELYLGYGDYDVTVDAPEGWLVSGTGDLRNPEAVLPPAVLERYRRAAASDEVVHVLTAADFGPGKATRRGTNGRLQWVFRADTVRDVAFSATRESLWDAARTNVGDRDGDGRDDYARVNAVWRASAPLWARSWRYAQQSVAHHSRFTGVPYPWPHMTAVEGEDIIGGGMEYPMMTLIGSYDARGDTALYGTTSHEIAHMWFPMIVGTDETRYGWMDEGTTDFNENEASIDMYGRGFRPHQREQDVYLGWVRRGFDTELTRWTNYQYPGVFPTFASYYKPAVNLATLRALLGPAVFDPAYRRYVQTWRFRHPKPQDFFNHFDAAAGRDLWWFWGSWYGRAWSLDHAVESVTAGPGGTTIVVRDVGNAIMPARLVVTLSTGEKRAAEVPVATWLTGTRTGSVTLPAGATVTKVEIDPDRAFPDVDLTNNVWPRP